MTRRLGAWLAGLAVILAVTVVPAQAQEAPPIEVATTFSPAEAAIGDHVTLTLRITHPSDVLVTVPRPAFPDSDVVAEAPPREETRPDGSVVTVLEWTFQPFTLASISTGPIPVRWIHADGTSGVIQAPPATLSIVPVRAEGDDTLRALKPQASVAGAPPAWVRPAGIALAVVAMALVAWIAVRAVRSRRREVPAPAVEHGPEEQARGRLDGLRGLALADGAAFQAYYGTISGAVRDYLGARFRFNAAALTTPELEDRMAGHGIDRWQARLVAGLLDRCDDAVYARRYPDPASADHDLTLAYEIVELGRPSEVPPGTAVPA